MRPCMAFATTRSVKPWRQDGVSRLKIRRPSIAQAVTLGVAWKVFGALRFEGLNRSLLLLNLGRELFIGQRQRFVYLQFALYLPAASR